MERKCKNCKCWNPNEGTKDGLCTARSPVTAIFAPTNGTLVLIRPSTKPEDGCYHDFVEATIE